MKRVLFGLIFRTSSNAWRKKNIENENVNVVMGNKLPDRKKVMTGFVYKRKNKKQSLLPLGGQSVLLKNDQASEHPREREQEGCFLDKKLSVLKKRTIDVIGERVEITIIRRSQSLRSG